MKSKNTEKKGLDLEDRAHGNQAAMPHKFHSNTSQIAPARVAIFSSGVEV